MQVLNEQGFEKLLFIRKTQNRELCRSEGFLANLKMMVLRRYQSKTNLWVVRSHQVLYYNRNVLAHYSVL